MGKPDGIGAYSFKQNTQLDAKKATDWKNESIENIDKYLNDPKKLKKLKGLSKDNLSKLKTLVNSGEIIFDKGLSTKELKKLDNKSVDNIFGNYKDYVKKGIGGINFEKKSSSDNIQNTMSALKNEDYKWNVKLGELSFEDGLSDKEKEYLNETSYSFVIKDELKKHRAETRQIKIGESDGINHIVSFKDSEDKDQSITVQTGGYINKDNALKKFVNILKDLPSKTYNTFTKELPKIILTKEIGGRAPRSAVGLFSEETNTITLEESGGINRNTLTHELAHDVDFQNIKPDYETTSSQGFDRYSTHMNEGLYNNFKDFKEAYSSTLSASEKRNANNGRYAISNIKELFAEYSTYKVSKGSGEMNVSKKFFKDMEKLQSQNPPSDSKDGQILAMYNNLTKGFDQILEKTETLKPEERNQNLKWHQDEIKNIRD